MWHFIQDDERIGPISEEDLGSQILDGAVTRSTLVWTEGMEGWQAASEIDSLAPFFRRVPPPIPVQTYARSVPNLSAVERLGAPPAAGMTRHDGRLGAPRRAERIGGDEILIDIDPADLADPSDLATPWPRFFARNLDVLLWAGFLSFAIGFYLLVYDPASYLAVTSKEGSTLFGLALVPMALVVNAVISAVFGNTLGKYLFGIRVVKLTPSNRILFFLGREFRVWFYGLALGIPIITLFTYLRQHGKVSTGRPATYDLGKASVVRTSASWVRRTIGGLLLLALFVGFAILNAEDKNASVSLLEPSFWTNPVTRKTTSLTRAWSTEPLQDADSRQVFLLTAQNYTAQAILAFEDVGSTFADLDAYIAALQRSLKEEMAFGTGWEDVTVDGIPGKRTKARSTSDNTADIQLTVVTRDGSRFWRTIVISRGSRVEDAPLTKGMSEKLLSTI